MSKFAYKFIGILLALSISSCGSTNPEQSSYHSENSTMSEIIENTTSEDSSIESNPDGESSDDTFEELSNDTSESSEDTGTSSENDSGHVELPPIS